jgi:DNA-binding CsgD family transcriptional regulator
VSKLGITSRTQLARLRLEEDAELGAAEPLCRPEARFGAFARPAYDAFVLFGRDSERARIGALLNEARASRSGVLVVRGEPGIGKTALLEDARDRAADMHVVTARGVESESELPFASLHQLLRPALEHLESLPTPQQRALRGALGFEERTGDDRFLVSVAVLSLLAEFAERRPVLALIDDAHWLDASSADTLLFVARRLHAEPIVLLFAVRDDGVRRFEAAELPVLELGGLADDAAEALLARRGAVEVAADVRDQLVEYTGGNALALLELPAALTAGQLSGADPLPAALPLTERVERVFLERVRRLPEPTQQLLLVAAADDSGSLTTIVGAAKALGSDDGALDAAEQSGLVAVRGSRLELRHPLVRSAVYQGAAWTERRAAHAALADALGPDEADRSAWHRAAAAVGSDEGVLRQLEHAAERASARGGHAAAAKAYERAAELTTDPPTRARRLVAAAVEASMAGRNDHAVALAEQADSVSDEPLDRAESARVRGIAELQCGTPSEGLRIFLAGARELPEGESEKALEMLVYAAESASLAGESAGMRDVSRAASTLSVGDDARARFFLRFLSGLGPFSEGDAAGAPLLEEAVVLGESADDAQLLFWASAAAAFMGDLERGSVLAGRAAALARQRGEIALVAHALSSCAAYLLVENRFAAAAADAAEAVRLGREIGTENLTGLPLGVLAMVAAIRGREAEARRLADEIAGFAHERGLALPSAFAVWALASVDLARGRWAEALERYEALSDVRPGFGHPLAAILTIPDRMETLVRLGRTDEAIEVLPGFEAWATHAGGSAKSRLASCRALVASGDEATEHFEDAVRQADVTRRFDLARIRLLYGEHLRRERRRVDARKHLRGAIEAFEGFDAVVWAERARTELRASGETARKRDPSTVSQLTPQELQIARMVSEGLTNKEVAARLFLSPRTVDAHMRNVFSKLAITSRTQLARLQVSELDSMSVPRPAPTAA